MIFFRTDRTSLFPNYSRCVRRKEPLQLMLLLLLLWLLQVNELELETYKFFQFPLYRLLWGRINILSPALMFERGSKNTGWRSHGNHYGQRHAGGIPRIVVCRESSNTVRLHSAKMSEPANPDIIRISSIVTREKQIPTEWVSIGYIQMPFPMFHTIRWCTYAAPPDEHTFISIGWFSHMLLMILANPLFLPAERCFHMANCMRPGIAAP